MTGYRLTFGTMHMRATSVDETAALAMDSLTEAIGTLGAFAEVIGHDYFVTAGTGQFKIRFEAAGDDEAYAAAKVALDAVSAPVDNVKVERRSRRYLRIVR